MTLTVRDKGIVTIPKGIRDRLGIRPGDHFEVEIEDGRIVLLPQRMIDASQTWFWTEEWQAGERRASEEYAEGHGRRGLSAEDALLELKSRKKS